MDLSQIEAGRARSRQMLRTALGLELLARLEDPDMGEVMLNPDGRVWIDRFDVGLVDANLTLLPADAERVLRLVAHHVGVEVHAGRPRLSAELPGSGERFEGLIADTIDLIAVLAGRGKARRLSELVRVEDLGPDASDRVFVRGGKGRAGGDHDRS
jgi:Flp pilus assembly CpaF family ATPase